VVIGPLAHSDLESLRYYQWTKLFAGDDAGIKVLSNLEGVGTIEVNAFQRLGTDIIQQSLREGFGLTVAEGLWKGKSVIGSNVGTIALQIENGVTGYLIDSIEQGAARVLDLLAHPEQARTFGERGRRAVRHKFLATTTPSSYLKLFQALARTRADSSHTAGGTEGDAGTPSWQHTGAMYHIPSGSKTQRLADCLVKKVRVDHMRWCKRLL
jgi:trehalose synthase